MGANDGRSEVLPGTLDLLVLKTLETMGPMHGWGISENNRRARFYALTPAGRRRLRGGEKLGPDVRRDHPLPQI